MVMAIPPGRLTREPTTPPRKQARYHAETPEKHTNSIACVGSVMSLRGPDRRVRPNAETCTLRLYLGGSRWQVEMPGGDLKEFDESQLASRRQGKRMSMPAPSMEPSQSSVPAEGPAQIPAQGRAQSPETMRIQQWIKVGTGEPSYPAVFFANPTQGRTIVIPFMVVWIFQIIGAMTAFELNCHLMPIVKLAFSSSGQETRSTRTFKLPGHSNLVSLVIHHNVSAIILTLASSSTLW